MRYLLPALLLLILSCNNNVESIDNIEISHLYEQVNKHRYTNNDSLKYFAEQISEKSKGGKPVHQAMGFIGKGLYYSKIAAYKQSLEAYQSALKLVSQPPIDTLLAKAHIGIGSAYKNMSNYPDAIDNLQSAYKYFEKLKNHEGMAGALSNIAQVYQLKEDIITSKQYLRKALELLDTNKLSNAYLTTAHTLANIHGMSNELDSALLLDEEGIRITDQMGSSMLKSPFLDNKANCFMYSNRPDSASIYFHMSLAIDSAHGNFKQVADSYSNLGMLAFMQKDYVKAESRYLRSIDLAKQSAYKQGERDAWNYLSKLYAKTGRADKALNAKERFIQLKDSIINEKTEARIAELETAYESEKKEQLLLVKDAQLSKQKLISIAIISIASALLIAGYGLYRRNELNKEKELASVLYNQQQEATIQILTAEEKERQRIASDLHDGIGQMMTAAWLNLQALGKRMDANASEDSILVNKTTSLVGESCAEIRQVSHNMMPNSLSRKGLLNALREFTVQLDKKVLSINLQTEEAELKLDHTSEIILYRVIQECVNNVVRHSGATELDISVMHDSEGVDILIEDNGKGFDLEKMDNVDGIGIQNIRSRIRYLNGSVEWDNTGNGTVVAIHIPGK